MEEEEFFQSVPEPVGYDSNSLIFFILQSMISNLKHVIAGWLLASPECCLCWRWSSWQDNGTLWSTRAGSSTVVEHMSMEVSWGGQVGPSPGLGLASLVSVGSLNSSMSKLRELNPWFLSDERVLPLTAPPVKLPCLAPLHRHPDMC